MAFPVFGSVAGSLQPETNLQFIPYGEAGRLLAGSDHRLQFIYLKLPQYQWWFSAGQDGWIFLATRSASRKRRIKGGRGARDAGWLASPRSSFDGSVVDSWREVPECSSTMPEVSCKKGPLLGCRKKELNLLLRLRSAALFCFCRAPFFGGASRWAVVCMTTHQAGPCFFFSIFFSFFFLAMYSAAHLSKRVK